ncbi:hypothetical protein DL771_002874 [Monosporascus sp. 5C6A]|nr:hypothetical protein DL771_002874 [Monosporascus sp. 5C6A]
MRVLEKRPLLSDVLSPSPHVVGSIVFKPAPIIWVMAAHRPHPGLGALCVQVACCPILFVTCIYDQLRTQKGGKIRGRTRKRELRAAVASDDAARDEWHTAGHGQDEGNGIPDDVARGDSGRLKTPSPGEPPPEE